MTSNMNDSVSHLTFGFAPWDASGKLEIAHQTPNIKPPPKRSNRPTKRTTFTPEQVTLLELEFAKNEYICKDRRSELAQMIDLTECQVKTWFQNRRTKKRRCVSPNRKGLLMKSDARTPSPSYPPAQQVSNLQVFLQGWPTQFTYSLGQDQQNKSA